MAEPAQDRLKQAKAQANRQHKKGGVLLIDLDDFKRVNDELGHQAGDAVRPHQLGKRSIVVGVSIGSALFREDAEGCARLIEIADAAMYRAKRASSGGRPGSLRATI